MSLYERYGHRDLTYSRWHRTLDHRLHWIDIDVVEYCCDCKEPLLMAELARDVGQSFKATTVLQRLADKANLPAFLVFWAADMQGNITRLRVKQVWPIKGREVVMTPVEYESWLFSFRKQHAEACIFSSDYLTRTARVEGH